MTLDQKIQIWAAAGNWVSAIGTLLAVGVALYLSRKSEKLSLRIEATFDGAFHPTPIIGVTRHPVIVHITNLAPRSVRLIALDLSLLKLDAPWWLPTNRFVRTLYFGIVKKNALERFGSSGLPKISDEISQGMAVAFFPEEHFVNGDLSLKFVRRLREQDYSRLRFYVRSSLGQDLCVKPPEEFLIKIRAFNSILDQDLRDAAHAEAGTTGE